MSKEEIIEKTLKAIHLLPEDKAKEISNFADFISKRYEETLFTKAIHNYTENHNAFEFLQSEEDLYSVQDLKEVYNAKR